MLLGITSLRESTHEAHQGSGFYPRGWSGPRNLSIYWELYTPSKFIEYYTSSFFQADNLSGLLLPRNLHIYCYVQRSRSPELLHLIHRLSLLSARSPQPVPNLRPMKVYWNGNASEKNGKATISSEARCISRTVYKRNDSI